MDPRRKIVLQAAEKAIANGYPDAQFLVDMVHMDITYGLNSGIRSVLFNPEFARAFWGDALIPWKLGGYQMVDPDGKAVMTPAYLFHMQQMAIASDPVMYLAAYVSP